MNKKVTLVHINIITSGKANTWVGNKKQIKHYLYAFNFSISNSSFCLSRSKFSISKSNFLLSFVRTAKCISVIFSSLVSLFLFLLPGAFCDDSTVKIWCSSWGFVSTTRSCVCTGESSAPTSSGKEHCSDCSCGSVALLIPGSVKIKHAFCTVLVEEVVAMIEIKRLVAMEPCKIITNACLNVFISRHLLLWTLVFQNKAKLGVGGY